jgi:hypothetical protein
MKFLSLVVLSAMLSVTACSSHCKKDKESYSKEKDCKEKCEKKSAESCHKSEAPKTEEVQKVEEVKKVEKKKKK